jgi:hypothetical protein
LVCFFFAARCFMGKAAPRNVAAVFRDRRDVFVVVANLARAAPKVSFRAIRRWIFRSEFRVSSRLDLIWVGCFHEIQEPRSSVDRVWLSFLLSWQR